MERRKVCKRIKSGVPFNIVFAWYTGVLITTGMLELEREKLYRFEISMGKFCSIIANAAGGEKFNTLLMFSEMDAYSVGTS